MRLHLLRVILSLALLSLTSCTVGPQPDTSPASQDKMRLLKIQMTVVFESLERYAADNSLEYPNDLLALQPKYLTETPRDPVSDQPILYQKTERGFYLGASGDYTALDTDIGFPKFNQDGFFALRAADFPTAVGDDPTPRVAEQE
jgi:hypothetical protein